MSFQTRTNALRLLDAIAVLKAICLGSEVVPTATAQVPETRAACDLLLNNAR